MDTAETLANTCGGFFISYAVALWVFPHLGIPMDPASAGAATFVMFIVSNIRAYATRRLFRWWENRPTWKCKVCGNKYRTREAVIEHHLNSHRPI